MVEYIFSKTSFSISKIVGFFFFFFPLSRVLKAKIMLKLLKIPIICCKNCIYPAILYPPYLEVEY